MLGWGGGGGGGGGGVAGVDLEEPTNQFLPGEKKPTCPFQFHYCTFIVLMQPICSDKDTCQELWTVVSSDFVSRQQMP